eukprot:Platyproteum_vivax@DN7523_c0_g2_i2.p1
MKYELMDEECLSKKRKNPPEAYKKSQEQQIENVGRMIAARKGQPSEKVGSGSLGVLFEVGWWALKGRGWRWVASEVVIRGHLRWRMLWRINEAQCLQWLRS